MLIPGRGRASLDLRIKAVILWRRGCELPGFSQGFRRPIRASYAILFRQGGLVLGARLFAASRRRVLCSCVVGSMASGSDAPKQYGITKPLSLLGPVEADLQRTEELEKVCN